MFTHAATIHVNIVMPITCGNKPTWQLPKNYKTKFNSENQNVLAPKNNNRLSTKKSVQSEIAAGPETHKTASTNIKRSRLFKTQQQPHRQLPTRIFFATDLQGTTQGCKKQFKMQPTPKKSKETYGQNRNTQNIHAAKFTSLESGHHKT